MIPVLDMNARIVIGPLLFTVIHSFKIEESIIEPGNKATIYLPKNMAKLNGKDVRDYIAAGAAVMIAAGYNGKYHEEFTGYVRELNAEMPLQIICDDEWYPYKQNSHTKSWKNAKLKDVLQYVMGGLKIECPDTTIGKFEITSASSFEVVRKLQQDYSLYSRMDKEKLYVDYSWNWKPGADHKYERQKNVKKSDLVWKRQEDFRLKVKVNWVDAKRKKRHTEAGYDAKGCNVKTVAYSGTSDKAAEALAKSVYNAFAYNGFSGTLTGFGTPRTHAGDTMTNKNELNPEQDGTFLLNKVTINYGPAGYDRENTVAFKTNS